MKTYKENQEVQLKIGVPARLRSLVKSAAALQQASMRDFVLSAIEEKIERTADRAAPRAASVS